MRKPASFEKIMVKDSFFYSLPFQSENAQRIADEVVSEVRVPISQINAIIDSYNQDKTIRKLTRIYSIYLEMIHAYPGILFVLNPYITFQNNLFEDIYRELRALGMHSIRELLPNPVLPGAGIRAFVEFLANLAPNKLEELLKILLKKKENQPDPNQYNPAITESYTESEDLAYRHFLKHQKIYFLNGNNSRNFKISFDNGENCVLKITGVQEIPLNFELELRKQFPEIFLPLHLSRHVVSNLNNYSDDDGIVKNHTNFDTNLKVQKNLVVLTDYCSSGNLIQHARKETPQRVLQTMVEIFIQMAKAVVAFNRARFFFADMKNENWLLNEKGQLKISDAKSFLPVGENSQINLNFLWESYNATSIASMHLVAPEIYELPHHRKSYTSEEFCPDKAHAWMLGKNIYIYLYANCFRRLNYEYLYSIYDLKETDFEHEEFEIVASNATLFNALKDLMKKLVTPWPKDRISVNVALLELQNIQDTILEMDNIALDEDIYRCEGYLLSSH